MTDSIKDLVRSLNYDLKVIQDTEWIKTKEKDRKHKFLYYDYHELRRIISKTPVHYDFTGDHDINRESIIDDTLIIAGDIEIVKFLEFFRYYLLAKTF